MPELVVPRGIGRGAYAAPLPVLGFFTPLPDPQAAAVQEALAAAGFQPPEPPEPPTVAAAAPDMPPIRPLSLKVQRIIFGLTRAPAMNERQFTILRLYYEAALETDEALSIEVIAKRLAAIGEVPADRAENYVAGALRSFGKRLNGFAEEPAGHVFGQDFQGRPVADSVPLVVLMQLSKGPGGATHHRLTRDGMEAVALVLGLPQPGAEGVASSADGEDPEEVVSLGMSRRAAELILRVARSRGVSTDEAIRQMTAAAGAG